MARFTLIALLVLSSLNLQAQPEGDNSAPYFDTTITAKGSKNELLFKAKTALQAFNVTSGFNEDKDLGMVSTRVNGNVHNKAVAKSQSLYYSYSIIIKTEDNKATIILANYTQNYLSYSKTSRNDEEEENTAAYSIKGFDKQNRSVMSRIIKMMQL